MKFIANNFKEPLLRFPAMKGGHMPGKLPPPPPKYFSKCPPLQFIICSFQDSNKDSYGTPVNPHKSWLQFQNLASTYDSSQKQDNLYKTKDGKVVVSCSFNG
jgi:hypothetical protein